MKIILGEKIRVYPNKQQEQTLRQAIGASRFAYNWALEMWQTLYRDGQKPNAGMLNRGLNEIKREYFPWMYDLPKRVVQEAVLNLGDAFDRFFKKQGKYPQFKKRKGKQSARLDNGEETIKIDGLKVDLPKMKGLRLAHSPRRKGKFLRAIVSCETGNIWHVSFTVETEIAPIVRENQAAVGVDLGIISAVTLSNGEKFSAPKPLRENLKRLKRLSRSHSRKKIGGSNRMKSAVRLAKLHWRIANIRRDFTHKITSHIVNNFSLIGIEDLNVKGMMANDKLSRAISDIGFHEIRRQLEYKSKWNACNLVTADRFFPSSKLCHKTGALNENLSLSDRIINCVCGETHDRDLNASLNLENYAVSRVTRELTLGQLSVCLQDASLGRKHFMANV